MRNWTVRNVMTHDVVTVREDTPYREIAEILTKHGISAVPVIDEFRHVRGIVSEADLLHKVEFAGEEPVRRFFETRRARDARSKAGGETARDLMSRPAVTTMPGTKLGAAARLMDEEHVKRLPVTDDLGRIVGIVSRGDLLRVFQRPDEDIRRDVAEDVLRRAMWVDPAWVQVTVNAGIVTLVGRLDNRTLTEMAARLTETVAGVVDVVNRLEYEFDDTELATRSYHGHPFSVS